MSAFFLVFAIAFSAVAVDAGSLLLARRNLQAAADAAALAAVSDMPSAAGVAEGVFADNGYDATGLTVEKGTYTADETIAAASRFAVSSSAQNAVRISKSIAAPLYFARAMGFARTTQVAVQATATRMPALSFAAGTRLAQLQGGLANALLGGLLGASLSLSAGDYNALASANIDALSFLDALAVRVHSTAVTYGDLGNASVTALDVINAASDVAQTGVALGDAGAASAALGALAPRVPAGASHALNQIFDVSLWAERSIGGVSAESAAGVNVNVLGLIAAAARVAGANSLVSLNVLTVPIAGTSIAAKLAIGALMAQVDAGHAGSSIHTAQIRLLLVVTLLNPVAGVLSIRLPIYIESAAGTATVTDIPCDRGGVMARLSAGSGLVTAVFGDTTDAALANFSAPVVPSPAALATINVLNIVNVDLTATGSANLLTGGPLPLEFSQSDIDGLAVKSVSATGATTMFASLADTLAVNATLLSNPGLLSGLVNAALSTILTGLKPVIVPVVTALATPLSQTLTALGLQLGIIDTIVTGVSCHAPVLVG